jgi:hypothetical protein
LCQLTRVLPWQHHGNQATVDLGGGESYAVDGRFSVSLWFTKGWCNSTSPMTEGVLFDHVQANATSGEPGQAQIQIAVGCPGQNRRGAEVGSTLGGSVLRVEMADVGLGRIVDVYYRSSTSSQIR